MAYNLFISHKHSDGAIARVVADFIETKKSRAGIGACIVGPGVQRTTLR